MTTKIIYGAVVIGAILGVLAFGGYSPFLKTVVNQFGTTGSTFNTAKTAAIVANLAAPGANATSSAILNTDGSSRLVTGYRYACTGVGTSLTAYTGAALAALTLSIGTSTTANGTIATVLVASAVTVATSTPTVAITSTVPAASSTIWPAGTYMNFNVNATNTALCTFGVDYLGS